MCIRDSSENFGQVEQHVQLVRVVPDVLKQDFRQQNQLVAVAVVQVLPLLVPFQPVIDHELQSRIQFLGQRGLAFQPHAVELGQGVHDL